MSAAPLLNDIITVIQNKAVTKEGSFILAPSDFNMQFMSDFFRAALLTDHLLLSEASKTPGENTITLKGKTALWGYPEMLFTIDFYSDENGFVTIKIRGGFPKEKIIKLPVVEWITVGDISITVIFSAPYAITSFVYHCVIIPDGSDASSGIPVTITKEADNDWSITTIDETSKGISGNQLVSLIGGHELTSFLPKPLIDTLSEFSITDITTMFNSKEKEIDYFQAGIAVKKGWKIAPGISLEPGLQLSLTLLYPTKDYRQLSGTVSGILMIGKTELPLFIGASFGSKKLLSFGIQPGEQVVLESFSDLLNLTNNENLVASLPPGLKELPGIEINELRVDFDPGLMQLSHFAFSVDTLSAWKIIDGYFEITHLSLNLSIDNPGDANSKKILGSVYGSFLIKDVPLMCSIEKTVENPDWTIKSGLTPGKKISLTKVTEQLFTGDTKAPGNLPDISFSQLEITVVPGVGSFGFAAQSADPWKFTDSISIDRFSLAFTKEPKQIKGHVSADLIVGTAQPVTISLSASLNETKGNGWQFEGKTGNGQVIPIDHLIEYISDRFHLHVKTPDWLKKIKLSNLDIGFNTFSKNFHFDVTATIPVADSVFTITTQFALTNDGHDKFTREITGLLFIGTKSEFILDIKNNSSDTHISASWHAKDESGYLQLEDIATAFGYKNVPEVPSSLKLSLVSASFVYDSTTSSLVISAVSAHFGSVVFVTTKLSDKTRFYGFGVNIHLGITLADIPLVGNKIPGAENIGIPDAGIWILSAPLEKNDDVITINALINDPLLPALPAAPLHARVLLHGMLHLGAQDKSIDLALGNTTKSHLALPSSLADAESSSVPTWIDIQKQFGIFHFNRIGFSYHDNALSFLLDAGMEMGPLSFTLDGLSITSPLTAFKPTFDLSGLGLAYKQGPLDIEGALLKLPKEQLAPKTKFQFDGLAIIKAGKFSLSATGSYAQLESGDPSLFIFAQVETALGGPPAFFITGVMAGFGFNRSLTIPAMDEVAAFPLLLLAQPSSPGKKIPVQDPMHMLAVMNGREPATEGGVAKAWIKADPGEYWLAVGLQFTSFQLVKSRALLIAEFGHDLSFALLGLSTLQLPQTSDEKHPYVFAELQLRAVLQPQQGFFGLSAILSSNSFVLTPDCHLTGGFALYSWFGPHEFAGQFVISMGGYHPAFKKPYYYPDLPRLGFNWAVSSTTSIKGGAYFALTPSCVMAGGALEALFHDGAIKAGFTAHADFLIAWRPFFFTASIGVSIGVEVNSGSDECHSGTSFSVSADVDMWGPPTGGKVHVHVVFVTFTVHFGSDGASSNNQELAWHEFNELLPHPSETCRITASEGIYKTTKSNLSSSGKVWIVRADKFSFFTEAAIPSSSVSYGDKKQKVRGKKLETDEGIHIRPMNKTGVRSEHQLKIFKDDKLVPCATTGWSLKPRTAKVPESLWGKPAAPFTQIPGAAKADMTGDVLVGYDVVAPTPKIGNGPGQINSKTLRLDYISPEGKSLLNNEQQSTNDYLPAFDNKSIATLQTIVNPEIQAARKKMCVSLLEFSLYDGPDDSMNRLSQEAAHLYDSAPMLQ